MLTNRDVQRKNKANKAVRACLLSRISRETLSHISKSPTTSASVEHTNWVKMLEVAKTSNEAMFNEYCSSQTSVN